jgi:glycosyltransferase involved in cell wall biosynthesis
LSVQPQRNSGHQFTPPLRVCIAYDRLFPWSIGGAERWYRLLAERLAQQGHRVTYVTTRQWPVDDSPRIPGVDVVAICPDDALYGTRRRRVTPLLRFGASLFAYLLRHGGEFDVVHTTAMSAANALAVRATRATGRFRIVLDWWEVWTAQYWRGYLGPVAGTAGWIAQRHTARMPHLPVSYSARHAGRLRRLAPGRTVLVLRGLLPAGSAVPEPRPAIETVVYAGRFTPEKQVPAIVRGVALARRHLPNLRAVLIGDGPDATAVRRSVASEDLARAISLPGFVADGRLREVLGDALCLALLSRREGYGLVVAEAAAVGVPSIVLDHPDNAASELVVDGVNGVICASSDPSDVASAILRVHEEGAALRSDTLAWFRSHERELTIDSSLPRLLALYRGDATQEHLEA